MAVPPDPASEELELSVSATESYRFVPVTLRRYPVRLDGFFSWHAGWKPAQVLTHPCCLPGDSLSLNFSTSAQGFVRLEICDESGVPMPGFDSGFLFGDSLRRPVRFAQPLSALTQAVRLKFTLRDADLYSLACQDEIPAFMRTK